MSIRIRQAVPGDADALVALATEVSAEEEGWLLADAHWRSTGDERRYIRALQRHPDAVLLVAEDADSRELVGRLSLMRDAHPSSTHVADLGLMVAQAHRRRGIGTALMSAAEAWARSAGIDKLELHVFPHNTPALAMYDRLGYEREGFRRRQYRRAGGQYEDVFLMAKHL